MGAKRCYISTLLLLSVGCTTSLATMTPAPTTAPGHVRVSGGVGGNIPAGQIVDLVTDGQEILDKSDMGEPISEEEQRRIEDLAIALLATPPSVGVDAQVRFGVAEKLDIGARFSSGAVGGDVRYQFTGEGYDGFVGSIGLGARFFLVQLDDWPVGHEYEDDIEIKNLKRIEVDLPLLFGVSGKVGHLWFGPKLAYSRFTNEVDLTIGDAMYNVEVAGNNFYYGAQFGFALGYEFIWVSAEITVAGVSIDAEATVNSEQRSVNADGLIVYPAGSILLEF